MFFSIIRNLFLALMLIAVSRLPVLAQVANGQDCLDVLRLSKTHREVVHSESDFQQNASVFCSEYSKKTSTTNSRNYAASYKFLSASMGNTSSSEDDIASKVCNVNNQQISKAEAYKEYVEHIEKGAFDAYLACKKLVA